MTGQGVLDLFDGPEVVHQPAPGSFHLYAHTLTSDPYAKSPHVWTKLGAFDTIELAATKADQQDTHAVVLHKGPIVHTNGKSVVLKG